MPRMREKTAAEKAAAEERFISSANGAEPTLDPYGERTISLRITLNAYEHQAITEAAKKTSRSKAAFIRHAAMESYKDLEGHNRNNNGTQRE